ncbi:phosphosulfolactate synthase [Caldalkalibacillus mannanilyticus]|uniref:phosphosulfolactate synthase n=1 Tax=Caldalkalibacillus mannanilyticus TaxID=1418 RepID=UPI0004699986|nr:phosphosulfolactate synthase [Caldalkalibacillus mannanilyticus]
MAEQIQQETWPGSLEDPSACRMKKPRESGLTMVLDKGVGLLQFSDVMETSAPYIDYVKLGFGTAALYPSAILEKKIKIAQDHQVTLYPGGTFFEVAFLQGKVSQYFEHVKRWGFETVEISDGTITLSREERNYYIQQAINEGFTVITECGKKIEGSTLDLLEIGDTLFHDLEAGAKFMIVEGRESGENVGLYDEKGDVDSLLMLNIMKYLDPYLSSLIWETPKKNQQSSFIRALGPNVNLGNIPIDEIYSLEALRRGLRSDTIQK